MNFLLAHQELFVWTFDAIIAIGAVWFLWWASSCDDALPRCRRETPEPLRVRLVDRVFDQDAHSLTNQGAL